MRSAIAALTASLALVSGCRCARDAPASTAPIEPWPQAERVLCVDLDHRGADLVAAVSGNDLWIGEPADDGARVRFRTSFDSPVELVTAGDYGRGSRLYVARGAPVPAKA